MNTPQPPGALAQSVTIGLRVVHLVIAVLAVMWLASNVRQIPPDQRAVVYRFGRIAEVHGPGLLVALPAPVDTVRLLPGPERQIGITGSGPALYLTGDGGVVQLAAGLVYRIGDAASYAVAEAHVPLALPRIFRAAATEIAARHPLDDFLVTDPDRAATAGGGAARLRDAVRAELVDAMNAQIAALAGGKDGLGVVVERVDITPGLPEGAVRAFNSVLLVTQQADQNLARAHTDAERTRQAAAETQDRLIAAAKAAAAERIGRAYVVTAAITALASEAALPSRQALLMRLWREKVAGILRQLGEVVAVDDHGGSRLLLAGPPP